MRVLSAFAASGCYAFLCFLFNSRLSLFPFFFLFPSALLCPPPSAFFSCWLFYFLMLFLPLFLSSLHSPLPLFFFLFSAVSSPSPSLFFTLSSLCFFFPSVSLPSSFSPFLSCSFLLISLLLLSPSLSSSVQYILWLL